ncbi:OPT family oligopeptide transporter [Thermoanaerobacterium thermosulfurigenes]|uniref:OPT family oligopeptide transporter n=1 Tax=Thermoanaerobacterium thermosulfurigenes TaxID=33950 RepID=UPI003EF4D609
MASGKAEYGRKLSDGAYGGISGDKYVPFVPAEEVLPESTFLSLVIGVIFAIVFAAANTYLGLKTGMTISAAIPAAVLSTGILKTIFRRNSILEANMATAIAATGESVAAGLLFSFPAIAIWGFKNEFTLERIIFAVLIGGLFGVLFVVPLRRYLTVEEHGKLLYPEGMAASEVLVTSNQGGSGFMTVLSGMLTGGIYKLLSGGFSIWSEEPAWNLNWFKGTQVGINVLASLLGVGFIVGIEISSYMLAGGILAWLGLIPLIKFFGDGLTSPIYPATTLIKDMSASQIWGSYIRYIGAGGVLAGGFITLFKTFPTLIKAFKDSLSGFGASAKKQKRTDSDISINIVIIGAIFLFLLTWLLPIFKMTFIGSLLTILFSFFFAVVSARMTGIVGESNNPVSGMTIATLLVVTSILKLTGIVGDSGMILAITIGGIVCIAAATAGCNAQSLKTCYIIGGSPKKVETYLYTGIVASSIFAGLVLIMLNNSYGIGSQAVAAPQATIMSMVVKGIMTGHLPWILILAGVFMGIMIELMHIPVLPFALGLYLPFELSAAVMVGGIIRWIIDRKYKNDEKLYKEKTEKGILISSGLVAGDALMGLVIAIFAGLKINIGFGANWITNSGALASWISLLMFVLLGIYLYGYTVRDNKKIN